MLVLLLNPFFRVTVKNLWTKEIQSNPGALTIYYKILICLSLINDIMFEYGTQGWGVLTECLDERVPMQLSA